jgi:hypothetical protein
LLRHSAADSIRVPEKPAAALAAGSTEYTEREVLLSESAASFPSFEEGNVGYGAVASDSSDVERCWKLSSDASPHDGIKFIEGEGREGEWRGPINYFFTDVNGKRRVHHGVVDAVSDLLDKKGSDLAKLVDLLGCRAYMPGSEFVGMEALLEVLESSFGSDYVNELKTGVKVDLADRTSDLAEKLASGVKRQNFPDEFMAGIEKECNAGWLLLLRLDSAKKS